MPPGFSGTVQFLFMSVIFVYLLISTISCSKESQFEK